MPIVAATALALPPLLTPPPLRGHNSSSSNNINNINNLNNHNNNNNHTNAQVNYLYNTINSNNNELQAPNHTIISPSWFLDHNPLVIPNLRWLRYKPNKYLLTP